MRFSPSFLDELRARVRVSEVVRRKVQLKKQGREWRGLSPFNAEKTPSFYVNDEKGFFHDFSSGKHGDAIGFLMEAEGLAFPEAVEQLAAMAGLPLPVESREQKAQDQKRATLTQILEWAAEFFEKELLGSAGREARDYLVRRGVSDKSRAQFRLGYAPGGRHALRDHLAGKGASVDTMIEAGLLIHGPDIAVPYDRFRNRLIFPIADRSGRVIAFGGRALEKDAQAKYLNSPETPLFHKGATLYNLHNARKAAHEASAVIAVEGYLDVIAMTAAGFPHTVAPLGTALTEEQCGLLWRMAEEPILCFDGDAAGLKAAYRAIDTALPLLGPGRTLRFVLLPGGQDPDELYRAGGARAIAEALAEPLPLVELLWRRETEGRPLDTPERRAGLERGLKEIASKIADESLRRYYSQELLDRLSALFPRGPAPDRFPPRSADFRGPRRGGPLRIGAALANSPLFRGVKPQIAPREALILLIFVNHPELLERHVEDLASLDFASGEAKELLALLLRCAAAGETTPEEVAQAISEAGLEPLKERLMAMRAHATLWSVRPDAAPEDAAESLRQALVLHRRTRALNKELRNIEARLAENPSEPDSLRLRDIQAQLAAIEGAEASIEGFGAASGRTKNGL